MSRLIALCLYHRDHFSEGHMREFFEYEAYHWSIMIMPEASDGRDCHVYDATDATYIDPETFRMKNPTMDWWFRAKENIDPALSSKLLGSIVIGEVPDEEVTTDDLREFFYQIPLPVRNQDPQQSCVTWAVNAIRALQEQGWVWRFDIDQFKDWALAYADDRMRGEEAEQPKVIQYSIEGSLEEEYSSIIM
ncbi:uncharacterized protein B0H64DRAFT_79708 [Chaetomium fimeti]|uniref:Uncharacterized protein n=1 Tax=Chaetomium fimeti TaxID=1854472 RepID=A0AAE0HLB5_9PEZI|nr:hypothetical protein B0H64DRAFT_79708 [Chaetomium fimeti]